MGRKRRAAEWLRKDMNEARLEHAKRRWRPIALSAGVVVAVLAVVTVMWLVAGVPQLVIGFVIGVLLTGFVALVFWSVDHGAGAQHLKFGSYGEESTADLFTSKRARRFGWEIRHNLEFESEGWIEDVDHVVFGPDGVYAIDSKWANVSWESKRGGTYLRDATAGANVSARHIRGLLRASGVRSEVVPVVMQWGPGGWAEPDWTARWFDGVLVVRGNADAPVLDEIEGISSARLDPDTLDRIRIALDVRIEGRPSAARATSP